MTLANAGLCAIVCLIAISSCFGQKVANSTQMTIFGFELEKPLNLKECQERSYGGVGVGDTPCFRDPESIFLSRDERKAKVAKPLSDVPPSTGRVMIYIPYSEKSDLVNGPFIYADLIDGKTESIMFFTHGFSVKDSVFTELKSKFGTDLATVPQTLQNAFGAKYESQSVLWSFDNLVVTFVAVTDKINHGTVQIETPKHVRVVKELESKRPPEKRPL